VEQALYQDDTISSRRGNIWRLVFGAYTVLWLTPLLQAQQLPLPRFTEQVQVTRILIDARVLDDAGAPVLDLGTDDFKVEIGGKLAPVESVSWVSGHTGTPEDALKRSAVNDSGPLPQGRLIIFFIQKDMEQGRIRGLVRLLVELRKFLDTFTSNDRIAVLSFDTYLKVWSDFTNDFDDIRAILKDGILFHSPGPVRQGVPITTSALGPRPHAAHLQRGKSALPPWRGTRTVTRLKGHRPRWTRFRLLDSPWRADGEPLRQHE